jgi:two-component system sensor histidine kinase VicK
MYTMPGYNNYGIFSLIGDSSTDIFFVFDLALQRYTYANPAFETLVGAISSEAGPHAAFLLKKIYIDDRDLIVDQYYDFLENPRMKKIEFRFISKDDALKQIKLSIYPIYDKDKAMLIAGIAEDITIAKENILYAEKINARKNSMLEVLSHDLKAPFGNIHMLASLIGEQLTDSANEILVKSVQFIQNICDRNIELIRNLVNQEFLESAAVELRKERADLVWEISDIINLYKNSEENIAKTFILSTSHEKIYANIDSLKFIQVINNLISNAIKFTPDDGIIEIDIKDQTQSLLITVKDNGIGIPEKLQPYLFEKFTKARRRGLRGQDTVGLGMSIIKTIIELHGGSIWFESIENIGSTFFIEIPKE